MKSIVQKENIRVDVDKCFAEYGMKNVNPEPVTSAMFEYAYRCKNGYRFDERESMRMILDFVNDEIVAKELWAVLTVYCFEEMVYRLLSTKSCPNMEDMFISCCSIITLSARSYSFDRDIVFSTYVFNALQNNIRRENRTGILMPIPDCFRIEAAKLVDEMDKYPTKTNAELARDLCIPLKTVDNLTRALRNKSAVSIDAPIDDAPHSDTVANFLQSDENLEFEYSEREVEDVIATKLYPLIEKIYGPDTAYIARLRTASMWGAKKTGFREIVPGYCRYLVTVKNLNAVKEQYPQYTEVCENIQSSYATCGLNAAGQYIETLSAEEREMFCTLLSISKTEAIDIIENQGEESEFYKTEVFLRKQFSKAFPLNGTKMTREDVGKNRRFRMGLRAIGLNHVVDTMVQMSSKG